MVVELAMDIEWVEFVATGMVGVEKYNIVVENKIFDMDDMMFWDWKNAGLCKRILANLVENVGFEPAEEAIPAKEKGYSMCFVQH